MLKWIFRGAMALVVIGVIAGSVLFAALWEHYSLGLPDSETLRDYQPPTMTRVHAGVSRQKRAPMNHIPLTWPEPTPERTLARAVAP